MARTAVRFEFDPEWRITLFTVVMVPLMASLGFWQLQRAEEKSALGSAWEQRQLQRPALLHELAGKPAAELAYVPVQLSGEFLPDRYFLLDNRIYQGRFGYEVLGILQLDEGGGTAVLVNRGWIAADASRVALPEVPQLPRRVTVTGHVYVSPGKPYLLAEQQLEPGWPKRLQAVEMDKLLAPLAAATGDEVFPYPVRINAGAPGALTVDWQIINVSPDKHRAYAVQWFTMATVLFIFYLLHCSNLWQLLISRHRNQD